MKTTIFGVLLDVNEDQDTVLRRLMRAYGFMMRFAFQRLCEGIIKVGAIERHCASETGLPLRYAKDAVRDAQELITSRHQAMRDSLTLWQRRAKNTVARLTALKNDHPDTPDGSRAWSVNSCGNKNTSPCIRSMSQQRPFPPSFSGRVSCS